MLDESIEQYIDKHLEPESEYLYQVRRKVHLHRLRPRMLSGHLQGRLLKMFCQMIEAHSILEIGTYAAYSTLCMAEAIASKERAVIDTIEIDDEMESMIRTHIEGSGWADKIRLYIGDALEIIPSLDKVYDLVFIDADKREYSAYYDLVFDKVRSGGLILADNTLWSGKVLDKPNPGDQQTIQILAFNEKIKNDSRVESIILPLRDGLSIIRKK